MQIMMKLSVWIMLWLAATAAAQDANETHNDEASVATLAWGRPGTSTSSTAGPRYTTPPKTTWYGWNDNRYCQWAPEQCIPSPYAVDTVTCYLDNNGYVVGLKYYYTDGSLGGQVGNCNGASQEVNAGDGGVFVGVQTCRGAWGGIKSITWFNDCGDSVTCGNTRTDMNSWDYWGPTWNAPQPSKFCVNWLNPDVWGQGYWNYFGGYQTQNMGFKSIFSNLFSKFMGFGWGHRRHLKQSDEVATVNPDSGAVVTAEVQAKLDEAQAKAMTFWMGATVKTPPYWETCTYVNCRGTPAAAKSSRKKNSPWYTSNPLQVKGKKTMWQAGSKKTSKKNWVKPTDNTYMGYKMTKTTYTCSTDYDGYYKNVWPIWKIQASCYGGPNGALSDLQFSFNKCYCPCACGDDCCNSGGGGGTSDGTGISVIFNLGCTCADVGTPEIDDLVAASAFYLQNYLETGVDGLGANSVSVEYNPDYNTDEPTGQGDCTNCVLTVDGIITANPGFDQQVVYDALVNLSESDEPDLCYYPDTYLDCANYTDLFPSSANPIGCTDPDPASGIFINVFDGPFKKANADKVKQMRKTIKLKTLFKSQTNLITVREAMAKLNKSAARRKAAAAKVADADDAVSLQQQIAFEESASAASFEESASAASAAFIDDVAGH